MAIFLTDEACLKPVQEYATKGEVEALAEKIKELKSEIAAKKKPARVIREEDDDE